MKDFWRKYILLCLFLMVGLFILMPRHGHGGDLFFWSTWSEFIFQNGLSNIYKSNTDYLPLFHYVLKIHSMFQGNMVDIGRNIYHLKLVSLLFHFVTGAFLIMWVRKPNQSSEELIYKSLFFILNIALLYNSIIWGQVDDIMTCFVFVALFFAYQRKVLLSLLFFVLTINFKLQGIIFLPILVLILLPALVEQFKIKNLALWIILPFSLQLLIVSPFLYSGTFDLLWNVVTNSVGKYPFISANAFNFWELLLTGDLFKQPDDTEFWGLSYKTWGLTIFFISSFFALLPLLIENLNYFIKKKSFNFSSEKLFLIGALIPLLFFFFNTQMHERYSHPALVFLLAYAILKNQVGIAILGCVAYFLNMEEVMRYMNLKGYGHSIFNKDFIAGLYLVLIVWLFLLLYGVRWKFKKNVSINA